MKLSTRSRYGTRMMVDLAQHFNNGPVQIGTIAKRQNISSKYLEQLVIPLKKANFIKSSRGPKGGYMLAKSPESISVDEIVTVLEGQIALSPCLENPDFCNRSETCPVVKIWGMATEAMRREFKMVTLDRVIKRKTLEPNDYMGNDGKFSKSPG